MTGMLSQNEATVKARVAKRDADRRAREEVEAQAQRDREEREKERRRQQVNLISTPNPTIPSHPTFYHRTPSIHYIHCYSPICTPQCPLCPSLSKLFCLST